MNLRRFAYSTLAMLAAASALTGCIMEDGPSEPESPVKPAEQSLVDLRINVDVNDSRSAGSRADSYSFEGPADKYELMSTLRIMIVRKDDNTVEYNELLKGLDGSAKAGEYSYRVRNKEEKLIYLFANETPEQTATFNTYSPDMAFTPETAAALTLTREPGKPLIDNTGETKTYLPMNEVFDITVDGTEVPGAIPSTHGSVLVQTLNLFVTRATVKFTFELEGTVYDDVRLTGITFNQLACNEFLLPNETAYNPAKTNLAYDNSNGRVITAYKVPANPANEPFSFVPAGLELPAGTTAAADAKRWSPALYFPETVVDGDYTVDLTLAFSDGTSTIFTDKVLDNLPSLPRNTHVIVHITLSDQDINLEVDLVPYIGINLDPIFGLDPKETPRN